MSYTDPSGFDIWSRTVDAATQWTRSPNIENVYNLLRQRPDGGAHDRFFMANSWARFMGHDAAGSIPGYGWLVNAFISGYEVWLQGGSRTAIDKTWGFSIGMYWAGRGVDLYVSGDSSPFLNAVGHAAVGCAGASAMGGDCGRGAAQSFAMAAAKNYIPKAVAYLQKYGDSYPGNGYEGTSHEIPAGIGRPVKYLRDQIESSGNEEWLDSLNAWEINYQDYEVTWSGYDGRPLPVYGRTVYGADGSSTSFYKGINSLTTPERYFVVAHEFAHTLRTNNAIGGGNGIGSYLSGQFMRAEIHANQWASQILNRPIPEMFKNYGH